MKIFVISILMIMSLSLLAEDHLVWITADPDTIYFDDNLTYSIIQVYVADDDNNPVEGAYIEFDSDIGGILYFDITDSTGIAESTFWESGDLGIATITAELNGEYLTTQVTIIMPVSAQQTEIIYPINEMKNYPNPFNPSTTITFSVNPLISENIQITIYNLKGQRIRTFDIDSSERQVNYSVNWNGTNESGQPVSGGVYFYKLQLGEFSKIKRMTLLK